ncbi:PDDEXK-like family protein [Sporosarcina sp. ITBMC105]
MAHETQITGAISELTAASLLMTQLGYEVAKPLVPEVYDFLARDPLNGVVYRVQVKTLRKRTDRDNALVVYARKGNGEPYTADEVDLIIGVDGDRAFMFDCVGLSEYWSTEMTARKRWITLENTTEKAAV